MGNFFTVSSITHPGHIKKELSRRSLAHSTEWNFQLILLPLSNECK